MDMFSSLDHNILILIKSEAYTSAVHLISIIIIKKNMFLNSNMLHRAVMQRPVA